MIDAFVSARINTVLASVLCRSSARVLTRRLDLSVPFGTQVSTSGT